METDKKVAKRTKRTKHTPILEEPQPIGEEATVAEIQPVPQETPPQQTPPKPTFTTDKTETYRTLLLERPNVPVITNMQEAVTFIGRYEQWNRKVKLQF